MPSPVQYVTGAELPDLTVDWADDDGDPIDFSTGWTFTVKIGQPGSAAALTKTSGVIGAATYPNLTVVWGSTELESLSGAYVLQLAARNTSSGKDRVLQSEIHFGQAIT